MPYDISAGLWKGQFSVTVLFSVIAHCTLPLEMEQLNSAVRFIADVKDWGCHKTNPAVHSECTCMYI